MSLPKTTARLILAGLVAAWMLVLSAAAGGADEGWVIASFHSDIVIAPNASLLVTEDIHVDFGSQQKHGIFRTIPLRYRYSGTNWRCRGSSNGGGTATAPW